MNEAEGCDDSNAISGDGCSFLCEVESGFQCVNEPSVCSSVCGDGLIKATETCDDNNLIPSDGCSACSIDHGFACVG